MFYKIVFFSLLFHTTQCSLVIDSLSQKGLHVSDYCPKMEYCAEGAHVMCMYYNPNQIMGPRCSNAKNISVTPDLASKLLDVSNAVRSHIALGKEKGKNGQLLPRGYGIFRLKWDNELATFAQVLANQCVLRHDMCRATKRFPDPGQNAGLVRFSYPDWNPVSKSANFTTPGLTVPKLIYALTQALKTWYGQKNFVTTDMITVYPDWTENPANQAGRLYLEMIHAPATHMGCGISAYTEYAYYDNNAALNYNSVQIICNYSSRPRKHGVVYNTTAPMTSEFTARCGCPLGSVEDDDCLCHEEVKTHHNNLMQPIRECLDGNCDPTVVLLPIFTMEDAPPEKLLTMIRNNDTPTRRQDSMEVLDIFREPEKHEITHKVKQNLLIKKNAEYQNTAASRFVKSNSLVQNSRKRILDVKNRHFGKTPYVTLSRYQRTPSLGTLTDHSPQKKHSIFTKQAKFMLPTNNRNEHSLKFYKSMVKTPSVIRKDVLPRKDFSNTQKLVNNYLENNKNLDQFRRKSHLDTHKDKYEIPLLNHDIHHSIKEQVTETILHTAEDKVINFNQYLINQNSTSVSLGRETEDTDRRLMTLLDNLEKEVKNIELRGREKKIFDAKIRKIYGKVLGRPDSLIEVKQSDLNKDYVSDSSKERKSNIDKNKHIFNYYNKNEVIDDRKVNKNLGEMHFNSEPYDKYSDFEHNKRLSSRNQNIITDDERQNYYSDAKHNAKMISSYEDITPNGRYNDIIKMRNTYKNNFDEGFHRNSFNEIPKRSIKKERAWDTPDDPLTAERRKYYQDKLENLERRLQNTRSYKRRTELENNKQTRRMRPTDEYHRRRSTSKKQIDPFYMPERARFLHSFR